MRGWLSPKLVVSIVYVTAMFMAALDGTIVNVALADLSHEFQIPPAATSGINVGYLVSITVFLPMAGWLGDRFGTKRMFLIALSLFTFASVLCGTADRLETLNLFRVIQGAGGGLLTPVCMTMLFRTFPPEERLKVSRSLVFPIAVAPALGPVIGGFLVEQFSWRWVFYINLPFGLAALLFGVLFLNEHKETAAGKLDLPGFLLSAPAFSLLMYALIQGSATGWSSPLLGGAALGGILLICVLIVVELRVKQPMLDFRLLSERLFRTMSIISCFTAAGLIGMLFIFPLMYQNALQASAWESGLIIFPEALGLMLASRVMPWSCKRLGARLVIFLGLFCTMVIFGLLSLAGPATNPWLLRVLFFHTGFFLGHTVGAAQVLTFQHIAVASMGRATTLFNVQNRLGSALGVAALASLLGPLGGTAGDGQPLLAAYRLALLGSAAFLLAALCVTLGIRKADVEAAMPGPQPAKPMDLAPVVKVGD